MIVTLRVDISTQDHRTGTPERLQAEVRRALEGRFTTFSVRLEPAKADDVAVPV